MRLSRGDAPHRPVGLKFGAAVGAVVAGVVAVAAVGALGLATLRGDVERLGGDDLGDVRAVGDVALGLHATRAAVLAELTGSGAGADQRGGVEVLLSRLDEQLRTARERTADDAGSAPRLARVNDDLDAYRELRRRPAPADPSGRAALAEQVTAAFDRMTADVGVVRDAEYAEAVRSVAQARESYAESLRELVVGAVVSLLVALTVVLLLVRDLGPRLRAYARFATDVAAGRRVGRLDPKGADELTELGRALDDMVARTEAARRQEADQVEFTETLQVTASEEEAHDLVQRHLERGVPGSAVAVLTRNNSENRLEAATALVPGSALATRLPGSEPRTCLALRFGRTHREDPSRTPLLSCTLCAEPASSSTCQPLLVGGQVIGAVLVKREEPLDGATEARLRDSVSQAAPVLGNLRNLALAEFRANNDSLTGLPNKRATDDTLKRLVAQADRSVTPLTAAMLDLDHFKQINDRFGHAKGDEVLAAVGAALRACLRAGDFAGRFGGEELLVLLPDTGLRDATVMAERIRAAIAAIVVPGVERAITVSIGLAELVQPGGEAAGLLRQADRALYTAKDRGRDRVVVATPDGSLDGSTAPAPADPVVVGPVPPPADGAAEATASPARRHRNGSHAAPVGS